MEELNFMDYFSDLPDPRLDRRKKHKLVDVIGIVVVGVLSGCECWGEIELYAREKETDFKTLFELPNGIPSHDTLERVFSRLSAEAFQKCFYNWANSLRKKAGRDLIAIDGKSLNGSDGGRDNLSLLHAWSVDSGIVIGAVECNKGGGEVPQIPALLKDLEIKDCVVTVDAGNARSSVAKEIKNKQAEYIMIVKANEKTLHRKIANIFSGNFPDKFDFTEEENTELNRGRVEFRKCVVASADQFNHLDLFSSWPGLKSIGYVEHVRIANDSSSLNIRFFISSLDNDAIEHQQYIREHWQVENKLHWVLDVAFGEDANRVRNKTAAKHLALIRRMSMGLLKKAKEKEKYSYRALRKRCGWSFDYCKQVLLGEI
jgi:predicted transposase YbfD/YdcC